MDKDFENLKTDVNDFLWTHLPAETTLETADKIAQAMFDLIKMEFDRRPEAE